MLSSWTFGASSVIAILELVYTERIECQLDLVVNSRESHRLRETWNAALGRESTLSLGEQPVWDSEWELQKSILIFIYTHWTTTLVYCNYQSAKKWKRRKLSCWIDNVYKRYSRPRGSAQIFMLPNEFHNHILSLYVRPESNHLQNHKTNRCETGVSLQKHYPPRAFVYI